LEPIPSICAPICISILQRSCTCGSLAAFVKIVFPFAKTAAIIAFSVAVTEASSRKISAPVRFFAVNVKLSPIFTLEPSSVSTKKCVSSLLLPITSPPGGGRITFPVRASKGPAKSIDALIFIACSLGISGDFMSFRVSLQTFGCVVSTSPPSAVNTSSITRTSSISGIFRKVTGSSVKRAAAIQGRAAFLFPHALIVPFNGSPPFIRYSLMLLM
jgi:hypothetical protein